MKKISLIFIALFCLVLESKTYANNSDSLTITELQKEVDNLSLQLNAVNKDLANSVQDIRFKPINFTLGIICKDYHRKYCYENDFFLWGIAVKYSRKEWNYNHYIYADITHGYELYNVGRNDNRYKKIESNQLGLSVGYLYNICNYIMLGATFDVINIAPSIILSITNDKIFTDLHYGYVITEDVLGIGISVGLCF